MKEKFKVHKIINLKFKQQYVAISYLVRMCLDNEENICKYTWFH